MSARALCAGYLLLVTVPLMSGCPKPEYWSHDVVPIPDNNLNNWAVSTIDVTQPFTIRDLNVTVNVTHPSLGECDAWLESPEAEIVPLVFGETGANLTNTTFNDEAAAPIDTGSAPYSGHWQVDSFYVNAGLFMVDGENALGTWTLNFRDQQAGNVGQITSWGLRFNSRD